MEKGKCFSGCNQGQRHKSDYYQTPYSLTKQLLENHSFDYSKSILEPACGSSAIVKVLRDYFKDITYYDKDTNFLREKMCFDYLITNPPFSLTFQFIQQAKKIVLKSFVFLLPLSYLHGQKRYENKIFNNLEFVYVFTRYPLLTENIRDDEKYETGMMVYAWYIWSQSYFGEPKIRWIDNNKYILNKKDNFEKHNYFDKLEITLF